MLARRQTSVILAVTFIALLSAFWFFPAFAFIFFISLLIQLLLCSIVDRLAIRLPRGLAAGSVLAVFLLLLLGITTIISASFVPTVSNFIKDLPSLATNIRQMEIMQDFPSLYKGMDDAWGEIAAIGSNILRRSVTLLVSTFNKIIDFVIIIFVTFYLLKDGLKIKNFLASLFPRKDKVRIIGLFNNMLVSLQAYVRSQLLMCCITGVVVYAYFTIMDVKYASVFAVVSGICEFVPVLGPTLASIFGIMLTATDAPFLIIQTACFYLIMTQINHNLVYPNVVGKSLNIHPLTVILGVVLGGELLGAAGMFLAVPCIVVVKHLIEDIYHNEQELKNHPTEETDTVTAPKKEQDD